MKSLNKGISLYGGIFNITTLTQMFTNFIILVSCVILTYNSFYPRVLTSKFTSSLSNIINKINKYNIILLGDQEIYFYKLTEYPLIIIFVICGTNFLMCSGDLISLFISIELQSYALYILSTMHRESEQSTWGGLTYFLLGGLSSCFILLGSGLLYVNSGTTSLEGIYIITGISEIFNLDNISKHSYQLYDTNFIDISLIFMSSGLLFKMSAAPFHFWSPDVYDALPTVVTTYVAIIAKISLLIFLLDLVFHINKDVISVSWKFTLLVSSMLSLIIGSLLGITQYRIKRVFAYSTISHLGFILLALCVNNTESIQGYIFYIISYTISNLNVFIIIVTIGYVYYIYVINISSNEQGRVIKQDNYLNIGLASDNDKSETVNNENYEEGGSPKTSKFSSKRLIDTADIHMVLFINKQLGGKSLKDLVNSPLQLIYQLKGFYFINSYLCLSLTITLFSLIGIPPLIGFFAKQMVLSSALDNGYVFISLIAILTSVISAVYYLNIVKNMFFTKPEYIINPYINKWESYNNYCGEYNNSNNDAVTVDPLKKNNTVYKFDNLSINSGLSIHISILTLIIALFMLNTKQIFNLVKLLSLLLFN